MAPSVAEFRRNQLKAPEQGQQQGQNALATLAGIGAVALAGVGAYRLAKGRLPKGSPASATAPVQTVDIARKAENMVRKAESENVLGLATQEMPRPSTPPKPLTQQIEETLTEMREEPIPQFTPRQYIEATGSVEQMAPVSSRSLLATDEEAMQQYSRQLAQDFPEPTQSEMQALESPSRYGKILSRLGTVPAYRPDPKDINYARFGPVSPEVAAARREQATEDLLQFARQRQEDATLVSNQAMEALESGEDQITGRTKNQLQRNEDLDLTQVEALENIEGNIRVVASQLPDGIPVDQAEGAGMAAQKFVSSALAKQRPSREPLLDIETKMYDLVATAAESGLKLEPKRALSILTNPGIELTNDEINLFNVNPEIGKFALKGQSFGPSQKQTGRSMSITGERLKSVPNVGLDPQSSITSAASGTSIRGRSRVQNQPDVFRQRVDSYGRPVTEDVINIDPGGTVTVSPGEELTELDIPEEVTSTFTRFVKNPITGKTEQEYAPKGMRAISTKEGKTYYVPIQDPGGVGIYGEERSYASGPLIKYDMPEQERVSGAYTKAAMRKPTDMPFTERTQGGARFTGLNNDQLSSFIANAPEGKVREAGMRELAGRQGLQISEALRRANIEGRDPNKVLRQLGFNL